MTEEICQYTTVVKGQILPQTYFIGLHSFLNQEKKIENRLMTVDIVAVAVDAIRQETAAKELEISTTAKLSNLDNSFIGSTIYLKPGD